MKYFTAQENINRLPAYCFGVLLEDKSLIRINAGETGYYKQSGYDPDLTGTVIHSPKKTTDQLADELNAGMGITKAQRKAMEWGSMFGWSSPLAMPEKYDANGKAIPNHTI